MVIIWTVTDTDSFPQELTKAPGGSVRERKTRETRQAKTYYKTDPRSANIE